MRTGLLGPLLASLVASGLAVAPRESPAENVASFSSATIALLPQPAPGPPGTDPIPLDIDPNAEPEDATFFSIPPGSIAVITVRGTTAAEGVPVVRAMDDDLDEFLRGRDDELDERGEPLPLPAGAEFEIDLFIACPTGTYEVDGFESSGEQSAEVYVVDGTERIPVARNLPGGGVARSWWKIDCDKETTQTLGPQGGAIHTAWGDSLEVPPGALAVDTEIRMANAYPLPHEEAVPTGFRPISEAQALQPDGLALDAPALLTFRYTQEEAGETADERTLQVFRYDPLLAEWHPIPGASVDPLNDRLQVPIPALGTYGFAAQTAAAVPALSPLGLAAAAALLLAAAALPPLLRRCTGRRRAAGGSAERPGPPSSRS